MKRLLGTAAVLAVALFSITTQAGSKPSVSGSLVFLGSSDAPGAVSPDRLSRCLQHLAQEMKVADKEMPLIVVFHVSPRLAETVGLKNSGVRRNTGQGGGPYFELWLVGQVNPGQYVIALQAILEAHFRLQFTAADRDRITARVLRYEQATVDAKAYGQ